MQTVLTDRRLKPCPFCNSVMLLTDVVQYDKCEDEGFRVGCNCGWAGRRIRKWYPNLNRLIEDYNDFIHDEV